VLLLQPTEWHKNKQNIDWRLASLDIIRQSNNSVNQQFLYILIDTDLGEIGDGS